MTFFSELFEHNIYSLFSGRPVLRNASTYRSRGTRSNLNQASQSVACYNNDHWTVLQMAFIAL
jgi:hypothetical protein